MALIGNLFSYLFCTTGIYYIYKILQEFNSKKLCIKLNDKNARLPRVGSKYAAGYDLYSCDEGVIKSNSMGKINIGISLIIPCNHYGRIASRSGLTLNYSLNVGAGVIDSDYRGNISVLLFNHGNKDFKYNIGDRVSQLIIEKISHCEIENVTEIYDTDRGGGGFGSTGLSNNNIASKYNEKHTFTKKPEEKKTSDVESDEEPIVKKEARSTEDANKDESTEKQLNEEESNKGEEQLTEDEEHIDNDEDEDQVDYEEQEQEQEQLNEDKNEEQELNENENEQQLNENEDETTLSTEDSEYVQLS